MPIFEHKGIKFNYKIEGEGLPFLLLHGLGDGLELALEMYQKAEGIKLVLLDQRGHGSSEHDFNPMTFDELARDAIGLMDYLGITNFFVGGLSMGAGVALNVTVHHENRILGLILIRSSSTDKPMKPEIQEWFGTVINYLPLKNGKQLFKTDLIYHSIKKKYPRAINTFNRYFNDPASVKYYQKFIDIPKDTPIKNIKELAQLQLPVLILANRYDVIHPIEYSLFYKNNIKNATYFELPPKNIDAEMHSQELNKAVNEFLIGKGS